MIFYTIIHAGKTLEIITQETHHWGSVWQISLWSGVEVLLLEFLSLIHEGVVEREMVRSREDT